MAGEAAAWIVQLVIPGLLARNVSDAFGAEGVLWLERLPALVDECARRWSLKDVVPLPGGAYNFVAAAQRDGEPVVLKVGVPNPELTSEIEALRVFDGRSAAALLAVDEELGALLVEQLVPGLSLAQLDDDEQATRIAAEVMRRLWRPAEGLEFEFPTVGRWGKGFARMRATFDGGSGPLPGSLVDKAERVFSELQASMDSAVLFHGDLHHHNILGAQRQPWLAIDPKGVVGEAAYETGSLLRNPLPWLLEQPHPERVLARRVEILVEELGFDRERVVSWGMSQAVLSAWWNIEDHGRGWEGAIACAELLDGLLGAR